MTIVIWTEFLLLESNREYLNEFAIFSETDASDSQSVKQNQKRQET